MSRRRFLFSYDISDDKRRKTVFDALLDQGDHVQYSVFMCELTPAERTDLEGRLGDKLHLGEDQLLVLDLGPTHRLPDTFIRTIGRAYEPPTRAIVV